MRDLPTVCLARKGHSTVENFNHSASVSIVLKGLYVFHREYKGCAQLARFNHIRDRLHVFHVLKDLTALGKDKQLLLEHADQGGTLPILSVPEVKLGVLANLVQSGNIVHTRIFRKIKLHPVKTVKGISQPCPELTKYQDEVGQAFCKSCPAGSICNRVGRTSLCLGQMCGCDDEGCIYHPPQNCPELKFCYEGRAYFCPFGYQSDGVTCVACPLHRECTKSVDVGNCVNGYWCGWSGRTAASLREPCLEIERKVCVDDNWYSIDCLPCPAGEYCQGIGLVTPSGVCSPGYVCPERSEQPQPCTAGYYCPTTRMTESDLVPCPPGFFCPEGSSQPSPCAPGTYAPGQNHSTCIICPVGFYCIEQALFVTYCRTDQRALMFPLDKGHQYMARTTVTTLKAVCVDCHLPVVSYTWSVRHCLQSLSMEECRNCDFHVLQHSSNLDTFTLDRPAKNIAHWDYLAVYVTVTFNDGSQNRAYQTWKKVMANIGSSCNMTDLVLISGKPEEDFILQLHYAVTYYGDVVWETRFQAQVKDPPALTEEMVHKIDDVTNELSFNDSDSLYNSLHKLTSCVRGHVINKLSEIDAKDAQIVNALSLTLSTVVKKPDQITSKAKMKPGNLTRISMEPGKTFDQVVRHARPGTTTFNITLTRGNTQTFVLDLPQNLSSIKLGISEEGEVNIKELVATGFRYPGDIELINAMYGRGNGDGGDVLDNITRYCQECDHRCCKDNTTSCIGIYAGCGMFCSHLPNINMTANCTDLNEDLTAKDTPGNVGVIPCVDNKQGDQYVYLVCFITGWWKHAGTSANVYFYMTGTDGVSGKKHVNTADRVCLQPGSEDWLVVTTEHSLGHISSITDVETGSSWNYIYNDWLAVDMGSLLSTTATIEATSEDQMRVKLKYKFMIQFSREIRNGHLWISIFSKSPASQFTRVQRLTCALSLLLSTMLTNLMFYGIPTDEPADQE
ncbi:PK1L2-like protein [Mya arenaria]|uniref:PK1L2-like protein n=1 Tax=Mya arenaria TaxID=6604 RepID=A0ABY7D9F0_MYAAR|nr:PK1L2-like protein [Mya arenaria]